MRIAIGSDHAGFALKQTLLGWLLANGHEVEDVGTFSEVATDYPRYGALVGRAVAEGRADRGVAVCGSGQGICMAANKIPGVRGGVIRDVMDAEYSRRHNDANVACFGERFTTADVAIAALEVFVTTAFEGGRHARRVDELIELDRTHGQAQIPDPVPGA